MTEEQLQRLCVETNIKDFKSILSPDQTIYFVKSRSPKRHQKYRHDYLISCNGQIENITGMMSYVVNHDDDPKKVVEDLSSVVFGTAHKGCLKAKLILSLEEIA